MSLITSLPRFSTISVFSGVSKSLSLHISAKFGELLAGRRVFMRLEDGVFSTSLRGNEFVLPVSLLAASGVGGKFNRRATGRQPRSSLNFKLVTPSPDPSIAIQLKSSPFMYSFNPERSPSSWRAFLFGCCRNNTANKPNEEATTSISEQALPR